MFDYRIAITPEDYSAATLLFNEYAQWLNIDLSFQRFEEELEQLTVMYGSADGGIILCRANNENIACVALRRLNAETAELKRMYVKPEYQGQGIGKVLLDKVIGLAQDQNYTAIRLDTLNHMESAIHLYKQYGFYEIPAYYHNPNTTAVYFEIKC